jgi:hypothetical protein
VSKFVLSYHTFDQPLVVGDLLRRLQSDMPDMLAVVGFTWISSEVALAVLDAGKLFAFCLNVLVLLRAV